MLNRKILFSKPKYFQAVCNRGVKPQQYAVVCDLYGTTVVSPPNNVHLVEQFMKKTLEFTNVKSPSIEQLTRLQGVSKRAVFEQLLSESPYHASGSSYERKRSVDLLVRKFNTLMFYHWQCHRIVPTHGTLDVFQWLEERNILVALTSSFDRRQAELILEQLNWTNRFPLIVPEDCQGQGRPGPALIHGAMFALGINDPLRIINIGDTFNDGESARAADVGLSVAVTNGTHSRELLSTRSSLFDEFIETMEELPSVLVRNHITTI
jgi:phosphoglycolate phosphatase-like HAD superfamily hydrolase